MYTVDQIMELSGVPMPGFAIQWIGDALADMGVGGIESQQVQLYDIVEGKFMYRRPYDIRSGLRVSVLSDTDEYTGISRLVGDFTFDLRTDASPSEDYVDASITDNSSIIDSLDEITWGWSLEPAGIGLYEWDDENGYWAAPSVNVDNGLKLSYLGLAAFIDGSDTLVASPDESSYLNIDDIFIPAVISYLRREKEEDYRVRAMYDHEYHTKAEDAKRRLSGGLRKVMPIPAYSVRRP